ncbi:MAG TPA: DUF1579 domain-containing protein [Candidatus Limnocylindria bacterium]|nr:DUF1579 domain-containing protein [Candidatus Limnocylindria bacterium]
MKAEVMDKAIKPTVSDHPKTGDKAGSGKPAIDKAELMKKVEAAGTPGPAHQALNAFVGEWKAEVKCWMEPDGPPNVSQGTSKTKWILNGRFLEEDFHGEMMGKPFTGRCLLGFDNSKQTFNSIWVDDIHTSLFTSEGKGEKANTVITLEGKSVCPATGQKDVPVKQIFRVLNPDKHVLEMFNGDMKSMEITYTRK